MGLDAKFALSLSRVILGCALAIAAWRICAGAIADSLVSTRPDLALAVEGDHARARVAKANAILQDDALDAEGALNEARLALQADPLARGALAAVAQALEAAGEKKQAVQVWRLAARGDLRDPVAQSNVLEQDLANGEGEAALARVDALLRSHPRIWRALAPNLGPILLSSPYREALTERLQTDPPWREAVLGQLAASGPNVDDLLTLYKALTAGEKPPTEDELRPFLRRLLKEGRFEEAYIFWLDSLPPERRPSGELLYNGRFQFPVTNMPFDWSFDSAPGVRIRLDRLGAKRILNVDFSGSRAPFRHVRHWLLLAPGVYAFSGLERAQGLVNDRGLRWRISCADDPTRDLATTALLQGDVPWREFAVEFTVPPTCRAQMLMLELPARVTLEQIVSGNVAYMNFELKAAP